MNAPNFCTRYRNLIRPPPVSSDMAAAAASPAASAPAPAPAQPAAPTSAVLHSIDLRDLKLLSPSPAAALLSAAAGQGPAAATLIRQQHLPDARYLDGSKMQLVHLVIGSQQALTAAAAATTTTTTTMTNGSATISAVAANGAADLIRSLQLQQAHQLMLPPASPQPSQLPSTTPTTTQILARVDKKPVSTPSSGSDDNRPAVKKTTSGQQKQAKIDATCTICGQHFVEKTAFNAHIKVHLKQKLKSRQEQKVAEEKVTREQKQQEKEQQQQQHQSHKQQQQQVPSLQQQQQPSAPASSLKSPPPALTPAPPSQAPVVPSPLTPMPAERKRKPTVPASPNEPPTVVPKLSKYPIPTHSQVMAELAACKPIPPPPSQPPQALIHLDGKKLVITHQVPANLVPVPPPKHAMQFSALPASSAPAAPPQELVPETAALVPPLQAAAAATLPQLQATAAASILPPPAAAGEVPPPPSLPTLPVDGQHHQTGRLENICTPEISDMEEDLMSYEMDFHNDLSSILDQIEKDFESPDGMSLSDMAALDTPPDSDAENNSDGSAAASTGLSSFMSGDMPMLQQQQQQQQQDELASLLDSLPCSDEDLLGFDKFTRLINLPAGPMSVNGNNEMTQDTSAAASGDSDGDSAMEGRGGLLLHAGDNTPDFNLSYCMGKAAKKNNSLVHDPNILLSSAFSPGAHQQQGKCQQLPSDLLQQLQRPASVDSSYSSYSSSSSSSVSSSSSSSNNNMGSFCMPADQSASACGNKLVQSPASVAKVGQLPAKALAVLSQLPFLQTSELVNVVKVEQSSLQLPAPSPAPGSTRSNHSPAGSAPDGASAGAQGASDSNNCTVINIECQQTNKNGEVVGKVIESYRAIDLGNEIKLMMGAGGGVRAGSAPPNPPPLVPAQSNAACNAPSPMPSDPPPPPPPDAAESGEVAATAAAPAGQQPPTQPPQSPYSVPAAGYPSTPLPRSKSSSECTVCGKTITTKNMARHMEKHTGKKKFNCAVCQATFYQKTHLKNHVATHGPTSLGDLVLPGSPAPATSLALSPQQQHYVQASATTSFKCIDCVMSFDSKPELLLHQEQQHGKVTSSSGLSSKPDGVVKSPSAKASSSAPPPAPKLFSCRTCQRAFSQKGHLNRHEKTHDEEELTCRVCSKRCKNRMSLARHRVRHLACLHCSTVFENKVSLQEHILKNHWEAAATPEFAETTLPSAAKADSFLGTRGDDRDNRDETGGEADVTLLGGRDRSRRSSSAFGRAGASGGGDSGGDDSGLTLDDHLSPDAVGESLADISNANFFDFAQELNDEFYSPDLF